MGFMQDQKLNMIQLLLYHVWKVGFRKFCITMTILQNTHNIRLWYTLYKRLYWFACTLKPAHCINRKTGFMCKANLLRVDKNPIQVFIMFCKVKPQRCGHEKYRYFYVQISEFFRFESVRGPCCYTVCCCMYPISIDRKIGKTI